MRILEHGYLYGSRYRDGKKYRYEARRCPRCECKFIYDLWEDIEYDNYHQEWVKCPECNVKILLNDNNSCEDLS